MKKRILMNDYYLEAVRTWQQSDKNLKHFAECCANVDGTRTLALAQDCKCSVDTIENYRNAYALYYRLIELPNSSEVWREAHISLWVKAAKLQKVLGLSDEKIMDYLQTASEEGMSRETFAAHVDNKENHIPQWQRRILHVVKLLTGTRHDWKSEMPPELQKRFDEATEIYSTALQQIADAVSET